MNTPIKAAQPILLKKRWLIWREGSRRKPARQIFYYRRYDELIFQKHRKKKSPFLEKIVPEVSGKCTSADAAKDWFCFRSILVRCEINIEEKGARSMPELPEVETVGTPQAVSRRKRLKRSISNGQTSSNVLGSRKRFAEDWLEKPPTNHWKEGKFLLFHLDHYWCVPHLKDGREISCTWAQRAYLMINMYTSSFTFTDGTELRYHDDA